MRRVDVAVIGAGVSGSVCARRLAELDPSADILVLDRLSERRYDRYHASCGEALSLRSFKESALPLRHVRDRIHAVREHWPGGIVIEEKSEGAVIDRPSFLRSLHSELEGRAELEKASLRKAVREGGHIILRTDGGEICCRTVVGADGAFSTVRRSLFEEVPAASIPVEQYLVDEEAEQGVIEFFYGERYRGGYRWRFPCGDMSNQGFPRGCDDRPRRAVEKGGRHIPIGGVRKVASTGACLLGDAGSMVNPLSFGGIRVAMLSATKAAEAIASQDMGSYQRWWSGSGFSDPLFQEAYGACKAWDDRRMELFMRPFAQGYRTLPMLAALLRGGEDSRVARAFLKSFKYGW